MNTYLTWTTQVSRPGIYLRTDGRGKLDLLLCSIASFIGGDKTAQLANLSADYVPAQPGTPQRQELSIVPAPTQESELRFIGPIKLAARPRVRALKRTKFALPTEPGIYTLSRDLGHAWTHKTIAVSIHRFAVGPNRTADQVFVVELPSLEPISLDFQHTAGIVISPALAHISQLNVQMLKRA